MKPYKMLLLLLSSLTLKTLAAGQSSGIKIPASKDRYANYVQRLENGDLDIDYTDFRNSFLESSMFSGKGIVYDNLKSQVYAAIKNKDYQAVVKATKAMLSIDYTSMFAHKYLQQTYKILGDTANQRKYHDIEFGLLNSIIKSGDGKTCATGWHVTQIEEEYFILMMIGAQMKSQSMSSGGNNTCDRMDVTTEEGDKTYYFEANKVFEQEQKLFGE